MNKNENDEPFLIESKITESFYAIGIKAEKNINIYSQIKRSHLVAEDIVKK